MERSSEYEDLAIALAEVRPAPRDNFAAELDQLVAAGFPRRSRFSGTPLAGLAQRIAARRPIRPAFAGIAAALVAIAVATIVIASSGSESRPIAIDSGTAAPHPSVQYSEAIPHVASPASSGTRSSGAEGGVEYTHSRGSVESASLASPVRLRKIERSAEIGLLAAPTDIADDSAKVFAAVHDANGIVLHSTTSSGRDGSARFELLIPSARLGNALAAFSSIDEVRSRHEATDDITKPVAGTNEELRDSQARVDGLLAQLAAAELESEREAIEAELRGERRHAARLRAQLARLHQRTAYSRVLVRIESGASTESGGAWGVDDAFGEAGHILGVAAGVTVIGLAILAPLFLIGLLTWLAQRLWLRSRRERALDA